MNRRGFLRLLAILPGAALPIPLVQAVAQEVAPLQRVADGAPLIRVITSAGPIEFLTAPAMWKIAGDSINFAGQLQFEALQTCMVERVEVDTVLGTVKMEVNAWGGFPMPLTSGDSFTLLGGGT